MINYWEYLVFKEYLENIVRNYVITTYWEYSFFFFFSVNIVINLFVSIL